MELSDVQKEADSAGRKALLFGVFAVGAAGLFGYSMAKMGGTAPDTQPVVVAARGLPPLTTLKAADLQVVNWPMMSLPDGTYRDPNMLLTPEKINVGELIKNEPILVPRVTNADSGLAVSTLIDPEKRAFVVQIDESMATAQILHPGAMVDVVATLEDPRNRSSTVTKTLLQNVKVLAIGDRVDVEPQPSQFEDDSDAQKRRAAKDPREGRERHRVVTLSVSLGDVELLSYAVRTGRLDLAMRASADTEIVVTTGVTTEKLLGSMRKERDRDEEDDGRSAAPSIGSSSSPRPRRARRSSPMIYRGGH